MQPSERQPAALARIEARRARRRPCRRRRWRGSSAGRRPSARRRLRTGRDRRAATAASSGSRLAEAAQLVEQARRGDAAQAERELDEARRRRSRRACGRRAGRERRSAARRRPPDRARGHRCGAGGSARRSHIRWPGRRRLRGRAGATPIGRWAMTGEVTSSSGVTGAHFSQTMVGRGGRIGERDRLDIADDMIGRGRYPQAQPPAYSSTANSSPGSSSETAAPVVGRARPDPGRVGAAAARQRPGIMRREDAPGEGDVGEVLATGVDACVDRQRRAVEPEIDHPCWRMRSVLAGGAGAPCRAGSRFRFEAFKKILSPAGLRDEDVAPVGSRRGRGADSRARRAYSRRA